ncbi:hypothetical protein TMU01_08220 [Tenuibacillus multivorans]|nr:hypothetical protein TMU01_08220 [Tenuibacillus multivorans]
MKGFFSILGEEYSKLRKKFSIMKWKISITGKKFSNRTKKFSLLNELFLKKIKSSLRFSMY